uniref:Uncharacterized protein n=1 Tax=Linum usitatissimum TaxID=4006 RepID=A0A172MLB9_LINUS|nr:hypothetical protein [Linum usitatissimum]
MSFRSSTGKDVGLMLEAEDPWVIKRKGRWVRESPDLYAQPHEDATKLHVSAKQSVIEISSDDDDGNVRSLVECSDNRYEMFLASMKPQGTSSFLDCCPNGGRIRKGGKDRNFQGTKERNIKAKDRQKCEVALNPITCKQFPDKGKREMDICNPVSQKRSGGVCVGPVVWKEINKKNGGGFCGGSKVKSAGQMGKNSTKMGYKEGSEKASSSKRGRPTRESKSSVQDTIKERKSSVSKHRKKCKAALDPIHCKMLPEKVEDVAEHIGSTKQRNEVTMNSQIVVKEEYPTCSGSDSDVVELDASTLPLGDRNPFVPAECREDTYDVYDHAITNSNSEFRLKLMEVLRQPYSDKEYNELLNEVSRARKQQVEDETTQSSSAPRLHPGPGMSYLDQHKDFAKKLDEVQKDPEGNHHRRETLNLLRGFVYWLQVNVAHC